MLLQEIDTDADDVIDDDDDCSTSICRNVTSSPCVGTTCSSPDVDHCAMLRPCRNSGTCIDTPSRNYACQCLPGLLLYCYQLMSLKYTCIKVYTYKMQ